MLPSCLSVLFGELCLFCLTSQFLEGLSKRLLYQGSKGFRGYFGAAFSAGFTDESGFNSSKVPEFFFNPGP